MRSKLSAARRELARLRGALISPTPEEIEKCLPALAEAAGYLASIGQELKASVASPEINFYEISVELERLKAELKMASKLIAHGAAFYQGWAKLLASAASGYTPSGDATPLTAAGTVSIQG